MACGRAVGAVHAIVLERRGEDIFYAGRYDGE